jgi:hydroxyacyl-ACP dehydratase HTD2-like protein with hotdog domain
MSATVEIGTEIPVLHRTPSAVELFSFSAAAWLLHRIHYDLPFTTEHDGHPGLLVHGPLQGTYMIQSVQWWLGADATMKSIAYRHSNPAYLGDSLECGGAVTAVHRDAFDVDLWVRKADGTVTTSGSATFALPGEQ